MSDERQFKEFAFNAKQVAEAVMATDHVGADIVANIKDLMQVIAMLETKLGDSSGQSGDMRILKGRYDKLKRDSAESIKEVENLKIKTMPTIISELRIITSNTNIILRDLAKTPEADAAKAAANIHACVKKIIVALH